MKQSQSNVPIVLMLICVVAAIAPESDAGVKQQASPRLYVGVADSAAGGWARYVRVGSGQGALWNGRRWTALCHVQWGPRDAFFATPMEFGRSTLFVGAQIGQQFAGRIVDSVPGDAAVRRAGRIVFRPLDDSAKAPPGLGDREGLYSSFAYHSGAGDLAGAEMVIASAAGVAVITFADASVSASLSFPSDSSRVHGDTVWFHVAGILRAAVSDVSRRVVRVSQVAPPGGGFVDTLPRRYGLKGFAALPAEGTCGA
jgi:hypothetical protein